MKKLSVALLALLLLAGVSVAQKKVAIKEIKVSAASVRGLPARKSYAADLTRKDAYYTFAAGTDLSRVQVHTSKGNMSLTELLGKANRATTGVLRIGATTVIHGQGMGHLPAGGTALVNCEGLLCTCTGDEDCNDMFLNHGCGDIAGCDERGCWCLRL
jgi:hypothetical protein